MSEKSRALVLDCLIALGTVLAISLLYYCLGSLRASDWPWPVIVVCALLTACGLGHYTLVWYLYRRFGHATVPVASPGSSVDVYVTACDEPCALIERTLRAAKAITYPHRTYLLDDSRGSRYRDLAAELGCEYLHRGDNHDRKAGNINHALEHTSGELLAVFDADHVPAPDFLDRALGFFETRDVGFVQVMQTFSNADESLVARAASETAMEYFNVTSVCKANVGAASKHGTNCVIRRTALESISGYRPGLAEDLETSIELHAVGWKSAYVCEALAPGLAPATFDAFCKQQLKWSRGVFEAALGSLRSRDYWLLKRIQRLSYAVRFSYYLVGLFVGLGMLSTAAALCGLGTTYYEGFLARLLPLAAVAILIRALMLRWKATQAEARRGLHFRGASLVVSAWPVYVASLVSTLLRIRIPFVSTPKTGAGGLRPALVVPQLVVAVVLVAALVWRLAHGGVASAPCTITTACLLLAQHWVLAVVIANELRGRLSTAAKSPDGDVATSSLQPAETR